MLEIKLALQFMEGQVLISPWAMPVMTSKLANNLNNKTVLRISK